MASLELCEFPGCGRRRHGRSHCQGHARQVRLGQELRPLREFKQRKDLPSRSICTFPGCGRPVGTKGLCPTHYNQMRAGVPLRAIRERLEDGAAGECSVEGCDRPALAKRLCARHRDAQAAGQPLVPFRSINPKGTGSLNAAGYRMVTRHGHPNAGKRGRIFEHIWVMSQTLGRPLLPGETVHHINGVRDDNRPENLELWVSHQPAGQRPQDLVAWAKEILSRYDEGAPA